MNEYNLLQGKFVNDEVLLLIRMNSLYLKHKYSLLIRIYE